MWAKSTAVKGIVTSNIHPSTTTDNLRRKKVAFLSMSCMGQGSLCLLLIRLDLNLLQKLCTRWRTYRTIQRRKHFWIWRTIGSQREVLCHCMRIIGLRQKCKAKEGMRCLLASIKRRLTCFLRLNSNQVESRVDCISITSIQALERRARCKRKAANSCST